MTAFDEIADVPEIYDPATNTWTRLESAQLAFPYYPFSFLLPDGDVLIAGAGERPAPTRKLDLDTNTWIELDHSPIDGGSAAMYEPGLVIKSGTGATTDEGEFPSAATTYLFDANQPSPTWRQVAPMARPRSYHTLTPLADGSVIVTGGATTTEGKDVSAAVYEAEIWSPATETWSTMASMRVPRLYHSTAVLLADGRVVVSGSGDSYGGPNQTTAEFFSPPYLFAGPRPAVDGVPGSVAYGAHMHLTSNQDLSSVVLMRPASVTHQFDEDARRVPLVFSQSGEDLTVHVPTNPNLAPPGYYMLVGLNSAGVPSVADWVQVG